MTAGPEPPVYRSDAAPQFAALDEAFQRALATRSEQLSEHWFVMAGRPTRFRVVGTGLAKRVLRPFLHLSRDPASDAPALTVDLWDEDETGVGSAACITRTDLDWSGEFGASPDGRFVMHEMAQTKSVFDRQTGRIVGWAKSHLTLTLYETGRPLHSQLLLWHKDRGIQAVHAGLIARDGQGVLFGGPGGSGKSTVALTCHEAGFDYLGDDYIGVEELEDGGYLGHSVYSSTHVDPDHLKRFPALLPHAVSATLPHEDKSVVLLAEARPERLVRSARIRAIALPRVAGQPDTTVREASSAEALLQLAPSSLMMLPHAGLHPSEFERLGRIVSSVPTYRLELGSDLDQIPLRVEEILVRSMAGRAGS